MTLNVQSMNTRDKDQRSFLRGFLLKVATSGFIVGRTSIPIHTFNLNSYFLTSLNFCSIF